MKKINVIAMMILVMGLIAVSCIKEKENVNDCKKQLKTATAKKISNLNLKVSTDFSGSYSLFSKVGHTANSCNNNCIMIGGKRVHVNCQGAGNICDSRASISVYKANPENPENIYYNAIGLNDYEPTDDTTFYMPDRSYYIENDCIENGYIYLNIPSQILRRDSSSNQFIYFKITFTETALFENL
jgi:hypothetical protein